MEHLELELEAHIWWFCSTHEYCKTTKYERPTPSQLGDRADYFFPIMQQNSKSRSSLK